MLIRKHNLFSVVGFVLALLLISTSYARSGDGSPRTSGNSPDLRNQDSSSRQYCSQPGMNQRSRDENRTGDANPRVSQPYVPTTLPNGGRVNRNEITDYGSCYNRADNNRHYTRPSDISDVQHHRRYGCDRYGRYHNNYYYRRSDNVYRYVEVVTSSGCRIVSSYPRKYVFVSLNGYWPGYNYYRYYSYRTYPYYWYITGDSSYQFSSGYETFADVSSPAQQDSADRCFEQGVNYFAIGDYSKAADYFFLAKSYAPTDDILPFAYIQALFAAGNYLPAAQNLRAVMERQPLGSQWAFYPRGLYRDDNVLLMQINTLISQASVSGDYQLLAGYQLMGVQRFDEAMDYLNRAKYTDSRNSLSADKLIYIVNNLKANYPTVR